MGRFMEMLDSVVGHIIKPKPPRTRNEFLQANRDAGLDIYSQFDPTDITTPLPPMNKKPKLPRDLPMDDKPVFNAVPNPLMRTKRRHSQFV
tara:strand:+ start:96 stop:368 length:273 start_codon:yes stop_codon:yes gene_type:complete